MSRNLGLLGIVVSTAALGAGYLLGGYSAAAFVIVILGAAWLLAAFYRWSPGSMLGLVFTSLTAGTGILLDLSLWSIFAGAAAGLASWDLTRFEQRLRGAASTDDVSRLEIRHLGWLGGTLSLGLLLAAGSMLVQAQISFGWTMIFAILGVLGLVRIVTWAARD